MSATKTTLVAVVVLVLTFGAGVAVGVFADHVLMIRGMRHGLPPFATHMMATRLGRHLDLTATQKARIEQILERRRTRMNQLWSSVRPHIHEELEQTNAEISAVLTPEQRAKFERMKLRLHGGVAPGGRAF